MPVPEVKVITVALVLTAPHVAPDGEAASVFSVSPVSQTPSGVASSLKSKSSKSRAAATENEVSVSVIVSPAATPVGVVKRIVWLAAVLALMVDSVSDLSVKAAALATCNGGPNRTASIVRINHELTIVFVFNVMCFIR